MTEDKGIILITRTSIGLHKSDIRSCNAKW
jgi:hypothetical protein